ncbi:flagellar basal-body rod protein FlgG [Hyphomicrobium sp.]|uniref:flagellar basal-body rod protein FlgG n=1 Tax=Hyphomicrobium sp. TaxID=82 RepID=UPI002E2FB15D|nr:flagellar basal-body rod protein FlgG [Hyphomicrobium sp.]HEX2841777.1 flagellar basal-body rod protein FlgG [Hyphomicrobium sp.]
MRALSIAATGMNAQQTNLEVIANNIANINTTGYKRQRAEFTDLLYQAERALGAPARGGGANVPEGAYVGLGVRTAAIRDLHQQGSLAQTNNKLDVAINGRGWFQITGADGETFYTRDGALNKNDQGQIVTLDGLEVQPAMTVPIDATDITINETGEVYVTIPGQAQPQLLGQLTLANFVNDAGLEPMGGNLFRQTESSGDPVTGVPGDVGFGKIHQGYLENSNVDAVKEITQLIAAQRAYEMNSKVIQTVDAMYGTVANNMR